MPDWSRAQRVYIDWDEEERLARDHAARRATNASSSAPGWERNPRQRR